MARATKPEWLQKPDAWLPMAQKDAPDFELIDAKVHYAVPRRTDITSESIVGKAGVNAVMDTGVTNEPGIGIQQILWIHSKIWSNAGKAPATGPGTYPIDSLTQADVEYVASTLPLCFAEANEFYEGNPWGTSDITRIQFHWFYQKRRQMYAEKGMTYRQYCTYGGWDNWNGDPWPYQTGDGSQKMPNDPFFKAKVASIESARKTCAYFVTREPEGGGAIIKHYADQPDYKSRYYNKAIAAEGMALGMGATPGIPPEKLVFVMWGKIEGLSGNDGFQHNGFYIDRPVGDLGVVRLINRHPQVEYDFLVANWFCIGFCRTIGALPFDERTKFGSDPAAIKPGEFDLEWLPNKPGAPVPYTTDGYPVEPLQWHDASFEAAYYYSLCNRTKGEAWQYCSYTEEGFDTVVPETDGTTILEHASANDGPFSISGRRGRADAMFRRKGNALDVWVYDPSRDKDSRVNIVLHPPGKDIAITGLQGSTLALYNETI